MNKVSIIIPVIRPEKAKRCIDAIDQNAGIPKEDYEVLFSEDTERIGCPKMVKKLVKRSQYDLVCFLGDDTIPRPDFLKNALHAMTRLPSGVGLVGLNDNPGRVGTATHWLAHKELLTYLDGEFFHTGYEHCFCDDELLVRCRLMNRYIYAYDAVIEHDHFIHKDGVPDDDDLKRVYSTEVYLKDMELFKARSLNDWTTPTAAPEKEGPVRVLVGVPSGRTIHAAMAMDLVAMTSATAVKGGIHVAVVNQNSSIIEVGRTEMVETALALKVDYLFTVDSDMRFPPETLTRLLSHGKDIVCCDAARRMPPYTSVVTGMDGKPIEYNADTPELVQVRGGTSACQLVKTDIFKKVKAPYYVVEWKNKTYLGEDYYFTRKTNKSGIKTWCDTALSRKIGHIGTLTHYIKGT